MYFSIFFPANRSHPRGHLLLSDTNRKEFKWVKEHTAEIYNNGGFDVIKVDKVSWNKMEDSDTYEGGGGEGEGGGYFSGSSALLGGGVYSWSCCKTQQLKKKKNLIKLSGFTNSTSHYIRRLSDVNGVIVSKTAGLMSVNASVTLHCPNFHVIVCFVLFFPACVQLWYLQMQFRCLSKTRTTHRRTQLWCYIKM